MTQEEIQLFANFFDMKSEICNRGDHEGETTWKNVPISPKSFYEFNLKFDTDWNWLMTTVIAINKIHNCIELKVNHVKLKVRGQNGIDRTSRYLTHGGYKEAVYRTLIEYLKWYALKK